MLRRLCFGILVTLILCPMGSAAYLNATQLQHVKSALSVDQLEVLSLNVPADLPESFSVDVMLDGAPARLVLQRHSLRAPSFRVRMESADRSRSVVPPPVCTYRGTLAGQAESTVAASLIGGQLFATVLLKGAGRWDIQPLGGLLDGADRRQHVAYTDSNIVPGNWQCGTDPGEFPPPLPAGAGLPSAGGLPTNALLAFDADWEYYHLNLDSMAATVMDIETTINAVEVIYESEVGITYSIGEIIVQESPADPYSETDSGLLLTEFRVHWNANHSDIERDAAHLMTGKVLDDGFVGRAYIGVICENLVLGYGLSQSMFSSNMALRTALTAHELGHNWSATHCSAIAPDCAIMCAWIGGCSGDCTSFGSSATTEIIAHRDSVSCVGATCVLAKCAETIVVDEATTTGCEQIKDGLIQCGDDADVVVALVNVGSVDCTGVDATLGLFDHPGITENPGPSSLRYPDLPAGTGNCVFPTSGDWDIQIARNVPAGTYCADITITSDQGQTVILNGVCIEVGAQPWLTVTPGETNLGVIGTNTSVDIPAQVNSNGCADLIVTGVNWTGSGGTIADVQVTPDPCTWGPNGDGIIPPGELQPITVTVTTSSIMDQIDPPLVISVNAVACYEDDACDTGNAITITGLVSDGPVVFCLPDVQGFEPSVSGDIIVWASSPGGGDIYGHDLVKNETFAISTHPGAQFNPFICGDLVIWNDLRDWDGNGEEKHHVYAYDLNSRTEFALITDVDPSVDIRAFGCSGQYMGFKRSYREIAKPSSPAFAYNIFAYDLTLNVEIPCTTFTWPGGMSPFDTVVDSQRGVSIGGGTLAWEEETHAWSGTDWDQVDSRIRKHQFATGICTPWDGPCFPSAPTEIVDQNTAQLAADNCKVVFEASTPDDEQLFLWRECKAPNVIQITNDLDAARYAPLICGNYVFHIKGANPDWLLYTDLTDMSEHIIVQDNPDPPSDCDGRLVVWHQVSGLNICFTYVDTPEIALSAGDLQITPEDPFEVDGIDISATVHNLAAVDALDNIIVQFFDGDPDMGGVLLCEAIIAGLPGRTDEKVICNVMLTAGPHDICVRVLAPMDGHPGNNIACTSVNVRETGACCLQDGTCDPATKPLDCLATGGTYQGDGSNCPLGECPVPIGACCFSGGVCVDDLIADECAQMGGTYVGDASTCVESPPPCCPWDCQATPSGAVDVPDLLALLALWGAFTPNPCDFDGNGNIEVPDLLQLLGNWGPCP